MLVPQVNNIEDIYEASKQPTQLARYDRLKTTFTKLFNKEPRFFARSPGRVNIIGEHIDYSGYAVLPMALDKDVVIAVAEQESEDVETITIANSNNKKYPPHTFQHNPVTGEIVVDETSHNWSSYFIGAYKVIFELFPNTKPKSFVALVEGSVPAGAGVSSSAAYCCAAALAIATINKISISQDQLIEAGIKGEHSVGVNCGGMDQSISVLGELGSALVIHFVPKLCGEATPIPAKSLEPQNFDPPVFVIANTLVVADKQETAAIHYNLRVAETRLSAQLLLLKLNIKEKGRTLRFVADEWVKVSNFSGDEIGVLDKMIENVEKYIEKEPYSWDKIASILGLTVEELKQKYLSDITVKATHLELYRRSLHVYSEARRVLVFSGTCHGTVPLQQDFLKAIGSLMNESQASCRDLFDCSCKELDELIKVCEGIGAYGSRLTGAGWGGCVVNLVPLSKVESFVTKLKKEYYTPELLKSRGKSIQDLDEIVFYSRPGRGSVIYQK